MEIINKSIESISDEMFTKLSDACYETVTQKKGKIIASGLGKNVPICEKIVGTMNSLGIPAAFLHTNTAIHGDLGIVQNNDLVLLLSKSGNTSESIVLAEYLLKRKANVYAITFNNESTIGNLISNKLIINLEHEGDDWDLVPNNSSAVYLIVLQTLAIQLARRHGITLNDFKKNHPGGAIGQVLLQKK
jgi:arabinose-5-phosphate isomerase